MRSTFRVVVAAAVAAALLLVACGGDDSGGGADGDPREGQRIGRQPCPPQMPHCARCAAADAARIALLEGGQAGTGRANQARTCR